MRRFVIYNVFFHPINLPRDSEKNGVGDLTGSAGNENALGFVV